MRRNVPIVGIEQNVHIQQNHSDFPHRPSSSSASISESRIGKCRENSPIENVSITKGARLLAGCFANPSRSKSFSLVRNGTSSSRARSRTRSRTSSSNTTVVRMLMMIHSSITDALISPPVRGHRTRTLATPPRPSYTNSRTINQSSINGPSTPNPTGYRPNFPFCLKGSNANRSPFSTNSLLRASSTQLPQARLRALVFRLRDPSLPTAWTSAGKDAGRTPRCIQSALRLQYG